MSPEYGATVGFFPVDEQTLRYLEFTGRPPEHLDLVERYTKEQGLFRRDDGPDPDYATVLELDLDRVEPSLAGPRRPQDRIPLSKAREAWSSVRPADAGGRAAAGGPGAGAAGPEAAGGAGASRSRSAGAGPRWTTGPWLSQPSLAAPTPPTRRS
jgi:aconitate hydratase